MKKPTLIIGKKQVILSCLTLMLAVAVYVNYSMSKDDRNLTTAESGVHTYGETEFVNAKAAKATEVATDAAQEETTAVQMPLHRFNPIQRQEQPLWSSSMQMIILHRLD